MYLRELELRDFRNYGRVSLALPAGMVILHGQNGAGKSNLLEAVCVATWGTSPRARALEEMVGLGREHAFVGARVAREEEELKLEVGLARTRRRQVKINGVERRVADLIGLAPAVYFSADDIEVVKGEPAGRRRLVDLALCSVSRPYYFHLQRYRRALEQRNPLLKELRSGRGRRDDLGPWDRAAARYGGRVMVERREFIARLQEEAARAHSVLRGDGAPLLVEYQPSIAFPEGQSAGAEGKERARLVEEVSTALERVLQKERAGDILRGATQWGPHRDDIGLLLGGQAVGSYGSQGEQRSCAVAVRLGLAAVEESMTGERPLLLLDDVLSELDEGTRAGVFAACDTAQQVMITCCDLEDTPRDVRRTAAVFEVRDGQVV